jgi:hypothetical protein
MPVRETERVISIGSRKWKVKKFDALTGSYIALKLMSKISNIAIGIVSGGLTDPALIAMSIANELGSFSKAEFNEIQNECLHVCFSITEAGGKDIESPIRLPDGRWGVGGLEDDSLMIMTLVSQVLVFNLTSFFAADALKESTESFKGLIPFGALTSTTTPTLP